MILVHGSRYLRPIAIVVIEKIGGTSCMKILYDINVSWKSMYYKESTAELITVVEEA